MPNNPQSQSAFITRLPREIRDQIYLELWRTSGLRQHIFWHNGIYDGSESHFCHWPCTTEYQVEDKLQQDLEEFRSKVGVPFGGPIVEPVYGRRLQSPWMNHWACGEHAEKEHGIEAVHNKSTSGGACWQKNRVQGQRAASPSSYIPMLLSCKTISSECVESIYQSTTFVFTDLFALQLFTGYCETPAAVKRLPKVPFPPPALFKYARNVELSLSPNFPPGIPCTNPNSWSPENLHDVYDFHWLLNRFQKLKTVRIWISSRGHAINLGRECDFRYTTQLDADAIKKMLSSFSNVGSFTMSAPLSQQIEPEDGYVENVAGSNARLWKRGTGDRFHPTMVPIQPGAIYDGGISTWVSREVRVSRQGNAVDISIPPLRDT